LNIFVSGKTGAVGFECAGEDNILFAGLASGAELPYECGTGTCGTCKARLTKGDVVSAWPEAPGYAGLKREEGDILMCQSLPRGDCELALIRNAVSPMVPGACVPAHVDAVVRRRRPLTHDVLALDLDLARPLDFEAGQFVVMTVAGISGGRAYSMVNYERATRRLAFAVKAKPGGRFTEWFFGDRVEGAPVRLFGPLGHATFQPDMDRELLCIAGGSGVAGMMSILSRACQGGYFARHRGELFFGVRTARDLFFLDELAAFRTAAGDALRVTLALSDEEVDAGLAAAHPGFAFARGFVHAVAGEAMKGRFANVRAYAAGPPPMVSATLRMLLLEGKLRSTDIRHDKFS
jgi:toluene monooxygenase electron transfer component